MPTVIRCRERGRVVIARAASPAAVRRRLVAVRAASKAASRAVNRVASRVVRVLRQPEGSLVMSQRPKWALAMRPRRRRAIAGRRAASLLIAAKRAGLIEFDDAGEAYETLYGLIVKDWHVRMLLGEEMAGRASDFGPRARRSVSAASFAGGMS